MTEQKTTHLVGSLSDPVTTFQHTIETQRTAALAHEQLLMFQLSTLQTDLEATRRMILGCDSALAALSSGKLTNMADTTTEQTSPETPPATPPADETPPVTPPSVDPPVIPPADIPPFLTAVSNRERLTA